MDNGSSDSGFFVDVKNKGLTGNKANSSNNYFAKLAVLTKTNPNTIPIK